MPTVRELIDRGGVSDGPDGKRATRVWHVEGIATGDKGLDQALKLPGIPRRGAAHGRISGLVADDIRSVPVDRNQAEITATYLTPRFDAAGGSVLTSGTKTNIATPQADSSDPGQISIGSASGVFEQVTDNRGDRLFVAHYVIDEKTDKFGNVSFVPRLSFQFPTVDLPIPEPIIRFSRVEDKPPFKKAMEFENTVNAYSLGPGSYFAPRKWLCVRITGESIDGGEKYNVNYEFQVRIDTWDQLVEWKDPSTGQSPDDLVPGLGSKLHRLRREADFGKLGLDFAQLIP